jgi:hypothetical protein
MTTPAADQFVSKTLPAPLSVTEVAWDSPGRDSRDSMPLGNGDIGLNVWVEKDGDLLFYLSKTDAWDENSRLLKLGRLRLALSPNPFRSGVPFKQRLHTAEGCMEIAAGSEQEQVELRIWVDAHRPVVRIEIVSATPIRAKASLELWRTDERVLEVAESHAHVGLLSPQDRQRVFPDTMVPCVEDSVVWCHRNRSSCWEATLQHQGMADWALCGDDPLINRTFGALLQGEHFVKDDLAGLHTSTPQTRLTLSVHPLTAQTATLEEWIEALKEQASRSDEIDVATAYHQHADWWRQFWGRSWIQVSGTPEADVVTRGYTLQRFINACGGRGAFPIKFNGSIFTVDSHHTAEAFDADYRLWGGGYWFQNTRLTYWPMIMSGDFELMEPWFRMYLDAMPFAQARAKACFGMDEAAMFPETMSFWGTFLNQNYGYARGDLAPGLTENTYIRRYWQGMLELLTVLLDLYAVTQDEKLVRDKILVLAPPFLRFYREYYPRRDAEGKILFEPSQSLETWHDTTNPTPDIAALQWVLDGLLALPEACLPATLRTEWSEFLGLLPPLPIGPASGGDGLEILPAQRFEDCQNSENAALYAVFPYRLFGVGKPEIQTGLNTWSTRQFKETGGWRQDAIQAALLGLTEEAKSAVVENFSTSDPESRFPAFWGPNFDWVPDQDHGSAACIALQRMLLQYDGGKLRLLPAWPKEWDVKFKLHADHNTIVTCHYAGGKFLELEVQPASRRKDMILPNE